MPIIAKNCVQCHGKAGSTFYLAVDSSTGTDKETGFDRSYQSLLTAGQKPGYGKYIRPGRARTSPLIWHILGRNTSRPWDNTFSQQKVPQMPPTENRALTADEKRTFIEWIDMGALWDGIPDMDDLKESKQDSGGANQ